jgi:hypothetical protein
MPSVQSAFGPIVEPGWPSTLPGAPDLHGALMSAIQLKTQMNLKQQQLENQAMLYASRYENSERARELAGMKFEQQRQVDQWNHEKTLANEDYKYRQLDDLNTHRERVYELRELDQKRQNTETDLKIQKYEEGKKGAQYLRDVEAQLYREGLSEEDAAYWPRRTELLQLIPGDAKYPSSELSAANRLAKYKSNVRGFDKRKQLKEDYEAWQKDMGNTVWGTEQLTDPWPVFYPKDLKPQMTGGGWDPPFGRKEQKPTGKLIVNTWGPDGAYEKYVDPAELRRLRQEHRALEERKKRISPQFNDPTLNIKEIEELPKDQKDWRIGHTYMGPNGPGTWNGVGFDPYN